MKGSHAALVGVDIQRWHCEKVPNNFHAAEARGLLQKFSILPVDVKTRSLTQELHPRRLVLLDSFHEIGVVESGHLLTE